MHSFVSFAPLLLLLAATAVAALATPPAPMGSHLLFRRQSAASIVLQIAPTSNSCAGAAEPTECATAFQAAPFLIQAFARYKLFNTYEIAAVLALMAYETDDFKCNRNHFPAPGRPGQGTRNLQMPIYNLAYARSIPALADQVVAIVPDATTTTASLTDTQLNDILALVLPDQYSFASGAWFLATQCPADVGAALVNDADRGFAVYMDCVGASVTADRLVYWNRAKKAFGLA